MAEQPVSPSSKPPEQGASKIIVDSDWKAQAQKEREKLAAKEKEEAAKKGAGGPGGAEAMPPADFQALVGTMVTQALMYLGGFPDPQTGRAIVSLEHARFHIELLGVLEEKTKGNVTAEESADLKQAVHELRMRFVEIARAIAQMSKEGKLPGRSAAGGPGGSAMGPAGGPGGIVGPGM